MRLYGVSHRFETPIKGCRVMDSFVLLASFEFSVGSRALPVPCFSNCSWAECDVDRGRPDATRNVLERANFLLEGYFRALCAPLYVPSLWHC